MALQPEKSTGREIASIHAQEKTDPDNLVELTNGRTKNMGISLMICDMFGNKHYPCKPNRKSQLSREVGLFATSNHTTDSQAGATVALLK